MVSEDIKKSSLILFLFVAGMLLWLLPCPSGLNIKAWHLFIIFIITITAFIFRPLPIGAISIIAISTCIFTNTLTLEQSLSGFSEGIVWFIIFAFFIARGLIKTRLGERISYLFMLLIGRNTLGLSYGFTATEFLLTPCIPSTTARGAIIFPIVKSLSEELGSSPKLGTRKKIGAYLVKVCFQANVITSCMFMTAMVGNPLIADLAAKIAGIEVTWTSWALAAVVPGLINLILLPLILYYIYSPQIKETPKATSIAKKELLKMGSLSIQEKFMLLIFVLLLFLWIFGKNIGVSTTSAILVGFSLLLISKIITWDDVLKERGAWDILIWLSSLLMMAKYLTDFGLIEWFGYFIKNAVMDFHWFIAFILLILIYFYIHYFFASATAHIASVFIIFLPLFLLLGIPSLLSVIILAVASNLSAGITHYGTGTAPVYFEMGYVKLQEWWYLGGILSIANIIIWALVGSIWWKIIGLW